MENINVVIGWEEDPYRKYITALPFITVMSLWARLRLKSPATRLFTQPFNDCLLNRLFGRQSKLTSKLRLNGLCVWNSPGTAEFPAQMASKAENVSIGWYHHVFVKHYIKDKALSYLIKATN